MSVNKAIRRLLVPVFLLLLICNVQAQIRIASPYSRFGLGDISENNNAWNFSMGQTAYTFSSSHHINFNNPATYAAFDSSSFVFEGGFNAEIVTLTSDFQKATRNYASLGYLLFGFPVTHWWKTSIGLVPFSDVGYNVINYEEYASVGTVLRLYSGAGGINRLYWGNAFKIFRDLSIGFNASYLFGKMSREATVMFPDSIHSMNFKVVNDLTMNDLYLDFGVLYKRKLRKDLYLNLGGVFAGSNLMKAKTNVLATTFLLGSGGVEYTRDTIANEENLRGNIKIPMMAGGGIGLEMTDKFVVGIDFRWQNWKEFTAFGLTDSLKNSWKIAAGGEIIPDNDNYSSYFSRVRYRLGFFYQKTYLYLRGNQLNEYAFSAGLGLPLKGMKTALSIGAQIGVRGTTEQNLIQETYFRFVLGFSIYERWFIKRKYH